MRLLHFITLLLISIGLHAQNFNVNRLTCDNITNPLGISTKNPNLSWKISSETRNFKQTAYRILVSDNADSLSANKGGIWDSKKVDSDKSTMVSYKGKSLEPSKKYYWKVMIWDSMGKSSAWSNQASFQMGLIANKDWENANWICYEVLPDSMKFAPSPENGEGTGEKAKKRAVVPLFRKEFDVGKEVSQATLFISGLGQYEALINGKKIGSGFLTPNWTRYDKTILYNSYDVTGYLLTGKNAIGTIVGNGFFYINKERYIKMPIAFGYPQMICLLKIKYTDGTEKNIVSGSDWKTTPSAITFSNIYGGEDFDANLGQDGWDKAGFDDSGWKPAIISNATTGKLMADNGYPIAVQETIQAKNIFKISTGRYLYDFGQNASGIIELAVKGKAGQKIKFIPGELISPKNEINQGASGSPHYYLYTLKGTGLETWHPKFTYYGFRYVMVEGAMPDTANVVNDLPRITTLKFLHTRNSCPQMGSFSCSNELFNKIYNLINWAIKSNLQSVTTDCPHREKLGWLEQNYLMGNSINYNFDIYHLYQNTVQDMMDSQTPEGLVPSTAPEYATLNLYLNGYFRDSPEWGSASVILPWLLYKWYGDTATMDKAWPMMVKYVEYLKSKSDNHILAYGLGDWFDLGPKKPGQAQLTPLGLTATAIYYYDLKLLSEMSVILNKKAEHEKYSKWASEIKDAFNSKYFDPKTCVYATGSQTSMSMPLCLDLVDPQYRAKVVLNLANSIVANNKALTAGEVGFHYLIEALTSNGQSQLLYEMNNRDDVPGYGFQLKKGATALTESWPALENVSNNHLMLGQIMEWFYNGIGGIRQSDNSVAFKNIIIKPSVVGDLKNANTNFETPYGAIKTNWNISNDSFKLDVEIPSNTSALIYLPAISSKNIMENNIVITKVKDVKFIRTEGEYSIYQVESGDYHFVVK